MPSPPVRYEIRVLTTPGEHVAAYRLRHDTYTAMGYKPPSRAGLEIDEFDTRAVPLGAFDASSGVLIGMIRLVTTVRQDRHERIIRQILADARDPDLTRDALGGSALLLPSAVSGPVLGLVRAWSPAGFCLYEMGRGIVRAGHQGAGVYRGLLEFGIACAARAGPATIIGSCLPEHIPMYARHGYTPLPGTGLESFPSVGQDGYVIVLRSDRLLEPTRAHVSELLRGMGAGVSECALQMGRQARARYLLAPPADPRRTANSAAQQTAISPPPRLPDQHRNGGLHGDPASAARFRQ